MKKARFVVVSYRKEQQNPVPQTATSTHATQSKPNIGSFISRYRHRHDAPLSNVTQASIPLKGLQKAHRKASLYHIDIKVTFYLRASALFAL